MTTKTQIRALSAILLCLCLFGTVAAQECGNGVPCGPIPWSMPVLPKLSSPTPMPTIAVTQASGSVGSGTPTPTPTMTTTPLGTGIDTDGIQDQFDEITVLLQQTPTGLDSVLDLGFDLEVENLLTNGDLATWSGDNPTGWTVSGEGASAIITQVSGGARFLTSVGNSLFMSQNVMTVGVSYKATIDMTATTNGILVRSATTTHATFTTSGINQVTFTAANMAFRLQASSTNTDVVIHSVVLELANPPGNVRTDLATNAGMFFSYVQGLDSETFGPLAPLISLTLIALVLVLTVKILTFLLPIIGVLFGIIRKIVTVILEFIPL